MPLRSRASPTASSMAVRCTDPNAAPTCAISRVRYVDATTSASTSIRSPRRSRRTTAGSRRSATSRALCRSSLSSRISDLLIRTEMTSDTRTATSPNRAVAASRPRTRNASGLPATVSSSVPARRIACCCRSTCDVAAFHCWGRTRMCPPWRVLSAMRFSMLRIRRYGGEATTRAYRLRSDALSVGTTCAYS